MWSILSDLLWDCYLALHSSGLAPRFPFTVQKLHKVGCCVRVGSRGFTVLAGTNSARLVSLIFPDLRQPLPRRYEPFRPNRNFGCAVGFRPALREPTKCLSGAVHTHPSFAISALASSPLRVARQESLRSIFCNATPKPFSLRGRAHTLPLMVE